MPTIAISTFKWIACLVLATTPLHGYSTPAHCPADVASLQYRLVNHHQMVIDVSVNESGRYDFLFDTGTQETIVDPALAAELHLAEHGKAQVTSAGVQGAATFAQTDHIDVGAHRVEGLEVLVYGLANNLAPGRNIRGILGEDFLEKFDLLIDNTHKLLCLDDTGAMRADIKGQRIPLLAPPVRSDRSLPDSLVVSAHLSDGTRPVHLKLDSGANVPFLYNTADYLALGLYRGASLQGGGANGTQRTFTALPPQTMKIGSLEVPRVQFVTLLGVKKDSRTSDFDGLLTFGLFRRVFINHEDRFVVLDPL